MERDFALRANKNSIRPSTLPKKCNTDKGSKDNGLKSSLSIALPL
jgi:hypothetical protein